MDFLTEASQIGAPSRRMSFNADPTSLKIVHVSESLPVFPRITEHVGQARRVYDEAGKLADPKLPASEMHTGYQGHSPCLLLTVKPEPYRLHNELYARSRIPPSLQNRNVSGRLGPSGMEETKGWRDEPPI
jgi:hypothetical protein